MNNTHMKRLIKVFFYLILTLVFVLTLFNPIRELLGIKKYFATVLAHSRLYYTEGNFVEGDSTEILSCVNYTKILVVSLFRKSDMSYITEFPTDYLTEKISGRRFFKNDYDNDGFDEIFFGYVRNDSLFLCMISPKKISDRDKEIKEFFIAEGGENARLKNKHDLIHLTTVVFYDCNGDSCNEVVLGVGSPWGKPRSLMIYDVRNGRELAKKDFAQIVKDIELVSGNLFINLHAPFNGVTEDGVKDTFSSVLMTDLKLNEKYRIDFPGYSGSFLMIDTSKGTLGIVPFSHWDMGKYPTLFLTADLKSGKIRKTENLEPGYPPFTAVFSRDFRFVIQSKRNKDISIYSQNGKIKKKIPIKVSIESTDYPAQADFDGKDWNVFIYNDGNGSRSRIMTMDGDVISEIPGKFIWNYEDKIVFAQGGSTTEFDIVRISGRNDFMLICSLIVLGLMFLSNAVVFVLKTLGKYFFMLNVWDLYSKASPEAVYIYFGKRIIAKKQNAVDYSELLAKSSFTNPGSSQELVKWRGKSLEVSTVRFGASFMKFIGITVHDITSEIMNENYRMLLNATSLIAHDIKNGLTSVKAARQMMEMKGRKFDDETLKFFDKMESCNKNILNSCDNIMHLVYRNTERKRFQLMPLLNDVAEKYEKIKGIYSEDAAIEITSDENLLKYAVSNFVENAVHAVLAEKAGEVFVNVLKRQGEVTIEVINTRPFLDREVIRRISQGGYTTKEHGNGYGFMISRLVIEALGGSVEISSSKNEGVVVRVFLQC